MEPNKEAITKWVEALESEEFEGRQTKGKMVSPNGRKYCALGIRNYVYLRERTSFGLQPALIDKVITTNGAIAWTGINSTDPSIGEREDGRAVTVAYANDILGMSFSEIAQHLRKKYL